MARHCSPLNLSLAVARDDAALGISGTAALYGWPLEHQAIAQYGARSGQRHCGAGSLPTLPPYGMIAEHHAVVRHCSTTRLAIKTPATYYTRYEQYNGTHLRTYRPTTADHTFEPSNRAAAMATVAQLLIQTCSVRETMRH
jgi:hypothetical protein